MMNQFFIKWGSYVLIDLVDAPKTWRLHLIIVSCQLKNKIVNLTTTNFTKKYLFCLNNFYFKKCYKY